MPDLPAEPHAVTARIDWCGANVLSVGLEESAEVEIDVTNRHGVWRSQFVIARAPDTPLAQTVANGRKPGPWA